MTSSTSSRAFIVVVGGARGTHFSVFYPFLNSISAFFPSFFSFIHSHSRLRDAFTGGGEIPFFRFRLPRCLVEPQPTPPPADAIDVPLPPSFLYCPPSAFQPSPAPLSPPPLPLSAFCRPLAGSSAAARPIPAAREASRPPSGWPRTSHLSLLSSPSSPSSSFSPPLRLPATFSEADPKRKVAPFRSQRPFYHFKGATQGVFCIS